MNHFKLIDYLDSQVIDASLRDLDIIINKAYEIMFQTVSIFGHDIICKLRGFIFIFIRLLIGAKSAYSS